MEIGTLGTNKKTHRKAGSQRRANTQTKIFIPKQDCIGTQIKIQLDIEIHTPAERKTLYEWALSERCPQRQKNACG